jgi:hypothetical protein
MIEAEEIASLCARLDTFVEGRLLDDNATIMVNYKEGPRGSIGRARSP